MLETPEPKIPSISQPQQDVKVILAWVRCVSLMKLIAIEIYCDCIAGRGKLGNNKFQNFVKLMFIKMLKIINKQRYHK